MVELLPDVEQLRVEPDQVAKVMIDEQARVIMNLSTVGAADGMTNFAGSNTQNFIDQDGLQFGSLTGETIADGGTATMQFDNGMTRDFYQVPLVTFNNPDGLVSKSGNVYLETTYSGTPTAHAAGTGGINGISPSALDSSTVDIVDEFTSMIITQRALSTNTRVITTANSMLNDLVQIVR